ncbi:MAG: 30S ribosomal protein S6--L-glutamate ligase [Euryarchaeota archaeon]|nr:30S ribosomal protein S6--L-glutamate ligase [Euryarchaeota archaeon]|tara:strand:- start:1506 stop:2741 length:1236 start_codon:yes stop_codon:yes gene_type:complete
MVCSDCLGGVTLRLAILSRGPRLYSTRRLQEEALKKGIHTTILDPLQFTLSISKDSPQILHKGNKVNFDAVLPRIGHSITSHGVALLKQFEQLDVYAANSGEGIRQSRNKLLAAQILGRNNVPIPKTAYVRNINDVERAIDIVGGLPVVIKVSEGTQGRGVYLRHLYKDAIGLVSALLDLNHEVLIQQYIHESHGTDIRALVVGDKVVACMRRRARGKEFRSNFHLNGTVESIELTPEYEEIALRAARVLGLNIAGVDLLEGKNGPLVLEINSSPGLEGIEMASGVNVAEKIIDFLEEDAKFVKISMDQLLLTVPGHGILPIHLVNHPWLVGEKIGDLFSDFGTSAFALSRSRQLVWAPKDDLKLRYNDILIFYGDLHQLRLNLKEILNFEIYNNRKMDSKFKDSEKFETY